MQQARGSEESKKALEELYSEFAKLSADHQRISKNIISDIQTGKLDVEDNFSLGELITQYAKDEQDNKIKAFCDSLGMGISKYNQIMVGFNKNNPYGKQTNLISKFIYKKLTLANLIIGTDDRIYSKIITLSNCNKI